jgi:hypothetical protein
MTWQGTKWFIEGDIENCFDSIPQKVLLDIIARDIKDRRFLKLLKEMLQAGYMWQRQFHYTYSGTPQGSGVSPILANILLNELDEYIENCLIPQYNKGKMRRRNPRYQQLNYLMAKAWQKRDTEQYRKLKRERQTIPSGDTQDPNYCRLRYLRYSDDFLLGFAGSRQDALEIKGKIQAFLQTIGLTLSTEKTLITHATNERARFLGYEIYVGRANTRLTRHKTATRCKSRALNGKVLLSVPKDVADKWRNRFTKRGEPAPRFYLQNCSDYEIVQTYGVEFQGLANYYTMAYNISTRLYPVKYAYQQSLVRTLAAKHKQSMAWVYQQYSKKMEHGVTGFMVEVSNPHNPDKPLVAKFGNKPIRYNPTVIIKDTVAQFYHGRNELVRRLLANECELCGATNDIEVHHVRKLKDIRKKYQGRRDPPKWVKFMMARHRKTVVVCYPCHTAIHAGKYDGRKVE